MSEILEYLDERPEYVEILEKIVDWEENNPKPDSKIIEHKPYDTHWQISDVRVSPQRVHQLFIRELIDKTYSSSNYTYYALSDRDHVKRILRDLEDYNGPDTITRDPDDVVMHSFPSDDELDDDLFSNIVGYDRYKWLIRRGITTNDITNFLLLGEKGTGKTVFLTALHKQFPKSRYVVASESSSSGVLDVLFDELPMIFLVDEFDDMKKEHQAVFSSYTETGILSETKSGKTRQIETNIKTVAAANDKSKIKDNIFDRFTVLEFERYTEQEFKQICLNMLPSEEGKSEEEASAIADAVWDYKQYGDVRAAIQVARLSRGDPEKVVAVLDDSSTSPTDEVFQRF